MATDPEKAALKASSDYKLALTNLQRAYVDARGSDAGAYMNICAFAGYIKKIGERNSELDTQLVYLANECGARALDIAHTFALTGKFDESAIENEIAQIDCVVAQLP